MVAPSLKFIRVSKLMGDIVPFIKRHSSWLALPLIALMLAGTMVFSPFAHAAIIARSCTSGENAGGATTITINKPAGATTGDVLIATIGIDGAPGMNVLAGWTTIRTTSIAADLQLYSAYKVLTSSESTVTSYTFTPGGTSPKAVGTITAYSGVDNSSPINISNGLTYASSATLASPTATTTVANATVIAGFVNNVSSTHTAGSSMAQRCQTTSTGTGSAGTKLATSMQDITQAAAGVTGVKNATATAAAVNIGHTIALTPGPPSTLIQTAYRWFSNINAANFSTVANNPTTGTDAIYAAINDSAFIYTTGYISTGANNWRIEKRNLSDGALVSGFGTSGVVDAAVSANDDRAWGIDQDASFIYVAGQDATVSSTNLQWRIEKRDKTTGALVNGFGTNGVIQNNPTAGIDTPKEIKVDDSFIYIAGGDNTGAGAWRIEKRDKTTGALVNGFGTNGVIVTDFVATENEQIAAMVLDTNNVYVGGYDYSSGSVVNSQSRIEKRDKTTGALVNGFGTSGSVIENSFTGNSSSTVDDGVVHKGLLISGGNLYTAASQGVTGSTDFQWRITKRDLTTGGLVSGFGTNGVVNVNPSTAVDNPTSIRTDGTSLFVAGFDRSVDGGFSQWRIEKRDMTSGALVAGFGTSGVVTINPSANHDELRDIIAVGNNVLAAGYDSAPGNIQTRIEKRNTLNGTGPSDDASALAAQNTAATSIALNQQVRLRMLLRVATTNLGAAEQQFKLQFSPQSGTCDTAFSGETYADVTMTSAIAFSDNTALTDASAAYFNVNDPADGANPVIVQAYEEANNFTPTTSVPVGSNGLWDFALYNRSAPASTTYCFRAVSSDGATLSSYSTVPTLTTAAAYSVEQGNYRWLQNADSTSPGAALALQNTVASTTAGTPFRLRQLLVQAAGTMTASTALKIQSGEKLSTCSAASYTDVGLPMGFFNNASPLDNATITSTANDPTPASGTVVYQTYNEDGAFTNPTAINVGNSGLWDFSLTSDTSASGKTFCFRIVNNDGSLFTTYTQYPEMSFTSAGPTLDQQLRAGQSVINGTKTPITF